MEKMRLPTRQHRCLFLRTCAVLSVVSLLMTVHPAMAQQWSFVSSPDLFNSDIADLSGGSVAAINDTFPDPAAYSAAMTGLAAPAFTNNGNNSITADMASVYNQLFAEMQTNAGGNASTFLVAGDLINGRWPQTSNGLINNFGGGNLAGALDNAADIYYAFHREVARQHGFTDYLGAIGDHDIGDNDWSLNSSRANNVDNMKRAFGRAMVDPLGLPATWNGISSTAPAGLGEYDEGSFVKQVNNTLFVTVDVFRWEGAGIQQHPWFGSVTPEITGTVGDANSHLGWLDAVLTAADNDATIDHVIVQGHTPVLSGVRKQASSGMMMQQRDDSTFWQVLQSHDHQNGGKVRMYFGGEVHTVTSTKDPESDIVQLVHGNPPLGSGGTNYVVFNVDGKNISADLYTVDLDGGGGSYWQVSQGLQGGVGGIAPGVKTGSLTIDANGANTTYETSGHLDFVRNRGVLMHYSFDQFTGNGQASNSGSLTDLFYAGNLQGNPTTSPGKIGDALSLDGAGDFVKTAGGLAPISEGEQRTVAAWINTSESGTAAIFGYGQDNRANGEFNLQLNNGNLQLHIDNGFTAAANNPAINDGQWHHVAVVLPGNHANDLGDVLFYVDGQEFVANTANPAREIRTFAGSQSNLHVGANAENLNSGQQFNGLLDDVALWGSPLSSSKLRALVNAGNQPGLNLDTLEMESLFTIFDTQQGIANVAGINWEFASGLSGEGGDLSQTDTQFSLILDEGGNGVVGTIGMILTINRDTGSMVFTNLSGTPVNIDGYSISSELRSLDPNNGAWNSLFDQGQTGWVEANPSNTRISELQIAGSTAVAQGVDFVLGNAFSPNPAAFGESIEDVVFQYETESGEVLEGVVRYEGLKANNLVLVVNSATGEASMLNASDFDVSLDGYIIQSAAAELDSAGWVSLADQAMPDWVEANPSSEQLAELNFDGSTLFEAEEQFNMGDLFAGAVDPNLQFKFVLEGDDDFRTGLVMFELPGDFDLDGDVDHEDLNKWRADYGANAGSDADRDGDSDGADFLVWQRNLGLSVSPESVATSVPEPSSIGLTVVLATFSLMNSRQLGWVSTSQWRVMTRDN